MKDVLTAEEKKNYLQSFCLLKVSVQVMGQLVQSLKEEQERCIRVREVADGRKKIRKNTEKLLENLWALIDKKNSLCNQILSEIEQMKNETEKNLLLLKYVQGYTWEEVCEKMNYSLRQIYNLHRQALQHFGS